MAKWLKIGALIFAAGGVLELLLAAVAFAGIESPTSWTWATLTIVAMLLLITGLLIVATVRAKQREFRLVLT